MFVKKYTHLPVLYQTKCIYWEDTTYLHNKWYKVIAKNNAKILIRFNKGGAKWYAENRFAGRYQKIINQLKLNL